MDIVTIIFYPNDHLVTIDFTLQTKHYTFTLHTDKYNLHTTLSTLSNEYYTILNIAHNTHCTLYTRTFTLDWLSPIRHYTVAVGSAIVSDSVGEIVGEIVGTEGHRRRQSTLL